MINACHVKLKTGIELYRTTKYVKPRENPIFLKKGKIVISVKIQNFYRSRMTKWISSLELSREI